jgi:hypothetical protein
MNMRGCSCKGSIVVHHSCFQELLKKSNNPFQCSVCKTDFSGTFINKFISAEEILLNTTEKDEDNMANVIMYRFNGIEYFEVDDEELMFQTNAQASMYFKMIDKEFQDKKKECKFNKKYNMRNIRSNRKFSINKQRIIKWNKK